MGALLDFRGWKKLFEESTASSVMLSASQDYKLAKSFFAKQFTAKVQNPIYYGKDYILVAVRYYPVGSVDDQTSLRNDGYSINIYTVEQTSSGVYPILNSVTRYNASSTELLDTQIGNYKYIPEYKNLEPVATINSAWTKPLKSSQYVESVQAGIENISWDQSKILAFAKAQEARLKPKVDKFKTYPGWTKIEPQLTGTAKEFYNLFGTMAIPSNQATPPAKN